MTILFNVNDLIEVGMGHHYCPEHKLYGVLDDGNLRDVIYGKYLPNPIDIVAVKKRPASPLIHLLWNDWQKRLRELKREGII